MPRIAWVEDADARGQLAELYEAARARSQRGPIVADILRTMSLRPDFLAAIMDAARLHFSDGALTRAQHEMIAWFRAFAMWGGPMRRLRKQCTMAHSSTYSCDLRMRLISIRPQ